MAWNSGVHIGDKVASQIIQRSMASNNTVTAFGNKLASQMMQKGHWPETVAFIDHTEGPLDLE